MISLIIIISSSLIYSKKRVTDMQYMNCPKPLYTFGINYSTICLLHNYSYILMFLISVCLEDNKFSTYNYIYDFLSFIFKSINALIR